MPSPFDLPAPGPDARAHAARVAGFLAGRVRAAGGWLGFDSFMELALYAPGLGYYSAGAAKLGPEGDFVTAPEVSPLFARCIARAIAPVLAAAPDATVLEPGGGTGALAAELLPALARLGVAPRYLMLEVSADLRERQRALLAARAPEHLGRVGWLEALPERPFHGIVLANEVLDALPVSRFRVAPGGTPVEELGVALDGDAFTWAPRPARPALAAAVARIGADLGSALPAGFVSEASLRLPGWIAALAATLESGALLFLDYGGARREVYHAERGAGTLLCHYRHRAHDDPFRFPGLQDITAWVDFTAVADAAVAAGLEVAGYATQAHFLLDAGIEAELAAVGEAGRLRASQEAQRLLLPGEMGERFKAIALTRGGAPVGGFGFRDLRHLL